MEKTNCSEYRALMMGLMDNELTEEESVKLNNHMIRCLSCREEYQQLKITSSKLDSIKLKGPDKDILARSWKSPYSKFSKNFGILLIIGGWLITMIYGAYEFIIQKETEAIPKYAFVIILIGIIILFITVLRDRLRSYKTDPYKEVDK